MLKVIFYLLLLLIISLLVHLKRLVLTPIAGFPHGVLGLRKPIPVRPSPPPCG
jgi:hypothetical protein